MTNHNHMIAQQASHFEGNIGRVYVNPNFNKPVTHNRVLPNNGTLMHINPRFPHLLPNVQHNSISINSKIYINPNFIRPNNVVDNQCHSTNSIVVENEIKNKCDYQTAANEKIVIGPSPVTKSRYHLVRHNENTQPIKKEPEKKSYTVKLGKYKSVRIRDINRTPEIEKPSLKKPKQTISLQRMQNRFKFIKHNTSTPIVKKQTINKQSTQVQVTINISNKPNNRMKIMNGCFKKNNIPCPLFKKFGICIRNAKGICEFLHDKKHVSICRKFLKGICHDQLCPLSHELTAKKMPTCFFYLNGNCNKEHCPYLHVKLNEKTRTCLDFLKGYCENGSKCLNRHINSRQEVVKKRSSTYTSKVNKTGGQKIIKKKIERNDIVKEDVKDLSDNKTECRYYQETTNVASNSDTCNVIKPVRCKLGTLPSYIKF